MPEQVRPAPWLTAILISHVLLGVVYSFSIPMWEAYDEWGHYGYVRFVAEHFRLPNANDFESIPNDERRQPPLYYFITGTLTGWIKAPSDFFPQRNLLFSEDTSAGYNVAVHDNSEHFPYQGTALALHAARLVSVLLSALGVWATYHLVSLWLPGQSRIALLAAGLHAFWPQFLFNGSVVTNDLMASVCASLFIVALYGWWFRPRTWRSALGVLLTGGLLALSKFTVYGLVILGGLAFGISIVKHFLDMEPRGKYLRWAGGILLLVVVMGYVVWRFHWADILLNSQMGRWINYIVLFDEWPQHLLQADWLSLGAYLAYGIRTFWASFGWGNLEAPGWTYTAASLLVIGAIIGWIIQSRRSPEMLTRATPIFLSVGACLMLPLLHAVSEAYIFYFPGRYFLSAISPVCALLAAGYAALWPENLKSKAMLGLGIGFVALAAVLPFAVLLPRYQRPTLLRPEDAAEIKYPLDLRYGNSLQLVGYTVNPATVQPGQEIELTLYWRCLQPVPENYILTVKALEPDFGVLDEKYLFPGGGNFATSLWQPGDFFKESYVLSIPAWTYAPMRGQFLVDFLDADRRFALPLPKSAPALPQHDWFGEFKVAGQATHFQPETVTNYHLNDEVALKGYSLKLGHEQEITLDLLWETLRPLTLDYTISIRLLGSNGHLWAQVDSPPRAGAYPTHLWGVGERVIDSHLLTLPDAIPCGKYTLDLGVYEWTSQFRLPVTDEKGAQILDRAIKIPVTLEENCL